MNAGRTNREREVEKEEKKSRDREAKRHWGIMAGIISSRRYPDDPSLTPEDTTRRVPVRVSAGDIHSEM